MRFDTSPPPLQPPSSRLPALSPSSPPPNPPAPPSPSRPPALPPEGNGRLPSLCVVGTKTMVKAWRRQQLLALTVCFWHQNDGEGNGRLPSPCVFGTKTMAKAWRRQRLLAFTVCFWHQNDGEDNGRLPSPGVFGTKAMVKATSACLHHVFLAPKRWPRQRPLSLTVCFGHQKPW